MKAKDLIKILQAVDPDSKVTMMLGDVHDDEYRIMCSKVQLASGECLDFLAVKSVCIYEDSGTYADIVLKQDNYSDENLERIANDFDNYLLKEDDHV